MKYDVQYSVDSYAYQNSLSSSQTSSVNKAPYRKKTSWKKERSTPSDAAAKQKTPPEPERLPDLKKRPFSKYKNAYSKEQQASPTPENSKSLSTHPAR